MSCRIITFFLYRHVHGHFLWKYLCTWQLQINSHMMCTESVPFTSAKLRYKLNQVVNTVDLGPECWLQILFQSHCIIFSVLIKKKQLFEPWAYDFINFSVASFFFFFFLMKIVHLELLRSEAFFFFFFVLLSLYIFEVYQIRLWKISQSLTEIIIENF